MSVIMKRSSGENVRRRFQADEKASDLLLKRDRGSINFSNSASFHNVESHLATLSSLGAANASNPFFRLSPPAGPIRERAAVRAPRGKRRRTRWAAENCLYLSYPQKSSSPPSPDSATV